jgi:hypothetical protein
MVLTLLLMFAYVCLAINSVAKSKSVTKLLVSN